MRTVDAPASGFPPVLLEHPATIRDVAHAAAVSVGTASKALNGQGKLRAETIERVRAAAAHLEYRPNDLMQSVLRKRTFTVGLLTTEGGRFTMPMLQGIEDVLATAHISVFLCLAVDNPDRERQHLDSLLAKHVDGIIVVGNITKRPPVDIGRSRTPVLYVFTYVHERNALSLLPDNEGGGALAAMHLVHGGRRRFAHITGPADWEAVRLRLEGMRASLAEYGLDLPTDHVLAGPWHPAWGFEAMHQLLDRDSAIDAVFCGNDEIASGAMDALRERGRHVPGDVAVVGFDNWEQFALATRPPLTSVDMDVYELGRRAGSRMLALMSGERESGIVRLPCRLVVRASSAPRPAGIGN
jgi:LacI family transcriptional regulator